MYGRWQPTGFSHYANQQQCPHSQATISIFRNIRDLAQVWRANISGKAGNVIQGLPPEPDSQGVVMSKLNEVKALCKRKRAEPEVAVIMNMKEIRGEPV